MCDECCSFLLGDFIGVTFDSDSLSVYLGNNENFMKNVENKKPVYKYNFTIEDAPKFITEYKDDTEYKIDRILIRAFHKRGKLKDNFAVTGIDFRSLNYSGREDMSATIEFQSRSDGVGDSDGTIVETGNTFVEHSSCKIEKL